MTMTVLGIFSEWVITFLEVALCHYFMRIFFADRYRKRKQCFLYLAVAVVITTGVILLNLVSLSFSMATVLYFVIVNAIGGCILYKGRLADFLMIAVSYAALFNFFEWSIFRVISMVGSFDLILEIQTEFGLSRLITVTLTKTAEVIISLLLGKNLKKITAKLKKTKLVILCVSVAFISSLSLFQISGMASDLHLSVIQTVLTMILLFGLCFIYLFYRLKLIQNEQSYTLQQNYLLQENYEMAKASYQANAELYHDMRNHFLIVQNYLADKKIAEAQNYLEKISGNEAMRNTAHWTGIEAVDYLLGQKVSVAIQQKIEVKIHAEYPRECKIDPVDLCTILMNLFDNAVEACLRESDPEKSSIEVTIRRIHHFIIIRVSNTSSTRPEIKDGRLVTSKTDKRYHGWGLRSVQTAVEKYQGTMEYGYDNNQFTVSVMLFYR